MSTLKGIGGQVYLAPAAGSAAVRVLNARSWRIDIAQELVENTQGFGQIWKTYLLASTGWKGQVEGNFDTAQTTPFSAASQPTAATYGPVNFYLYPDSTNMARYYYGTIWPNLTVDARLMNTIRFTMPFTGDGALVAA